MTESRSGTRPGVGLISVGWMGKLHTKAYQAVPLTYPELGVAPRLVVAADTEPSRAQYAVDVLGYAAGTTDYREVLANPEVDVVSICAPNFLHAEMGVAAAEAGKHFWIEKPVGRGFDEAQAVARAAEAAGVVTSVGFNYRHAPAVEHMRELVAGGRLGRITNVRCVFFAGYSADPRGALSWRFQRAYAGSGVLGDLGSHAVDLCTYLVGPVTDVTALTSTVHTRRPILPMGSGTHFAVIEGGEQGDVENEDYVAALLRFGGFGPGAGAVGTIESSRVAVGPDCRYGIEIYGTEGSVSWDFERLNELKVFSGRGASELGYVTVNANPSYGDFARFQPGAGCSMGFDDLKTIEAKKFLAAVAGIAYDNSTIADAVASAAFVTAAEDSAASGQWVALPSIPGATAAGCGQCGSARLIGPLDLPSLGQQGQHQGHDQQHRHRHQHEGAAGAGAAVQVDLLTGQDHDAERHHVVDRVHHDGGLQTSGPPDQQRHRGAEEEVVDVQPGVAGAVGRHEEQGRHDGGDDQPGHRRGHPAAGGTHDQTARPVLLAGRLQGRGDQHDDQQRHALAGEVPRAGDARGLRERDGRDAHVDQPERDHDRRGPTEQLPADPPGHRVQPAHRLTPDPPLQEHGQRDAQRVADVGGQEERRGELHRARAVGLPGGPTGGDVEDDRPEADDGVDDQVADDEAEDRHHALPPGVARRPQEPVVLGAGLRQRVPPRRRAERTVALRRARWLPERWGC